MQDVQIRHDWSLEEIREIYNTPLLELCSVLLLFTDKHRILRKYRFVPCFPSKPAVAPKIVPTAHRQPVIIQISTFMACCRKMQYWHMRRKPAKQALHASVWVLPGEKCAITATSTAYWTW